ncbi:torso-like protein [Danaus plexippus]|uniref:torso-like protein n=1 Tax=Danaus plexippus TaxID=13037 RepID=UPI002AAFB51E|nr:torso-like protein [Danaus plexippus]
MFLLFLAIFFCCGLCDSEEGDLGYSLNIGNAIDVFANYGDLSQVTQVVSADYEDENEDSIEPFREKNIRVFENVSSVERLGDTMMDMTILLCETFEDLLSTYFQNFKIEGTEKPWKAFLGDWIYDEIMRTFGIEFDSKSDNCCYVLVKLSKVYKSVKMDTSKDIRVKEYVRYAVDNLNVSNSAEVRRFMKSYGTHYIDSYVTGNFIYQVFKYKRSGYNLLKSYIRLQDRRKSNSDSLRFYFSSYFLKQVGDIRIASGNKNLEEWSRNNLRDSQYLFSRPSLLRLHYNPILAFKLNSMLDNGALLGLGLKILKPIFKDKYKMDKYSEIVENDLKLWEVNA